MCVERLDTYVDDASGCGSRRAHVCTDSAFSSVPTTPIMISGRFDREKKKRVWSGGVENLDTSGRLQFGVRMDMGILRGSKITIPR